MKYALSAAALLQLAYKVNGQVATGEGASDISSDDWASVAENANFTQVATFTGRNVAESYPSESQDGWSLTFAMKDGVDVGGETPLTAGTISISSPEEETFDDSWLLCVHVFDVKSSSSGGFGSVNGCDGVVAPECVDDLRKNGIKNFGSGCPDYKTTPSCLRDIEDETRGAVIEINSDNAESLLGNDTSIFRRVYGSESSPIELLDAATYAQAVVTIFGSSSESEDDPFGEVTCVLPDTAEEGTEDPTEDAASGIAAFAGWAALTAAVAFQLL